MAIYDTDPNNNNIATKLDDAEAWKAFKIYFNKTYTDEDTNKLDDIKPIIKNLITTSYTIFFENMTTLTTDFTTAMGTFNFNSNVETLVSFLTRFNDDNAGPGKTLKTNFSESIIDQIRNKFTIEIAAKIYEENFLTKYNNPPPVLYTDLDHVNMFASNFHIKPLPDSDKTEKPIREIIEAIYKIFDANMKALNASLLSAIKDFNDNKVPTNMVLHDFLNDNKIFKPFKDANFSAKLITKITAQIRGDEEAIKLERERLELEKITAKAEKAAKLYEDTFANTYAVIKKTTLSKIREFSAKKTMYNILISAEDDPFFNIKKLPMLDTLPKNIKRNIIRPGIMERFELFYKQADVLYQKLEENIKTIKGNALSNNNEKIKLLEELKLVASNTNDSQLQPFRDNTFSETLINNLIKLYNAKIEEEAERVKAEAERVKAEAARVKAEAEAKAKLYEDTFAETYTAQKNDPNTTQLLPLDYMSGILINTPLFKIDELPKNIENDINDGIKNRYKLFYEKADELYKNLEDDIKPIKNDDNTDEAVKIKKLSELKLDTDNSQLEPFRKDNFSDTLIDELTKLYNAKINEEIEKINKIRRDPMMEGLKQDGQYEQGLGGQSRNPKKHRRTIKLKHKRQSRSSAKSRTKKRRT